MHDIAWLAMVRPMTTPSPAVVRSATLQSFDCATLGEPDTLRITAAPSSTMVARRRHLHLVDLVAKAHFERARERGFRRCHGAPIEVLRGALLQRAKEAIDTLGVERRAHRARLRIDAHDVGRSDAEGRKDRGMRRNDGFRDARLARVRADMCRAGAAV